MEDKRNLIIAVLLTAIVLFGWPYFSSAFLPQTEKPAPTAPKTPDATLGAAPDAAPGTATDAAIPTVADSDNADAPTVKAVKVGDALKGSARLLVETPKLKGSINLTGARIDDLLLLSHRTKLAKDSPPVRLFSPVGTKGAYFARFGWVGKGITAPDQNTVWTPSASKLAPGTPVTLSWKNDAAQTFEIALSIDKNYLITAEQRFINNGTAPAQVATFGILSRTGKSADPDTWNIHAGPMGVFNDTADYDWDYDDLDDPEEAVNGEVKFNTTGGWVGFTDKYWLGALIPDQKRNVNAKYLARGNVYQTQMITAKQTPVAPGQSFKQTSRLFAGAKEVEVLDEYTDDLGIQKLDYAIDWGWFRPIEKAFFWILSNLFELFGNFGVAIIGLTLVVRAFLFPIAQKQFKSMAQMRAVQPKMKKLQARFKDDKKRQQQEIMKLYKEEKVNPLAGCLPIVLQIPIFFALYKLLMLSIDMRHQPFMLWLKDLSAPDPLTPVNLFGLLPFDPPSFIAIGILPILLGLTMWLMQRLNPQPMDDMQKQIFAVMPWFLMFIMAPFAAGLQLYWVVSNIVSIAQQKWLYSKHPQLKEQMAKEAELKAAEKAKA
ncbi:MAG: membrane protein insertase YidC [Sphingorhabdus sp.]